MHREAEASDSRSTDTHRQRTGGISTCSEYIGTAFRMTCMDVQHDPRVLPSNLQHNLKAYAQTEVSLGV